LTPCARERKTFGVVRASVLVALASTLLLGACKRGSADAPPCAAVGAKFLLLTRDSLTKSTIGEDMRRGVLESLPAMRDSIVTVCTDSTWSAAVRKCLVEANDHVAFEACEQQLTDAQRRALDRSSRGEDAADESK
jgi:hypothetical protein